MCILIFQVSIRKFSTEFQVGKINQSFQQIIWEIITFYKVNFSMSFSHGEHIIWIIFDQGRSRYCHFKDITVFSLNSFIVRSIWWYFRQKKIKEISKICPRKHWCYDHIGKAPVAYFTILQDSKPIQITQQCVIPLSQIKFGLLLWTFPHTCKLAHYCIVKSIFHTG